MFNDSFLTFDEFAQNVLADNSYFSYEPGPSVLSDAANLPAVTPLGSAYIPISTSSLPRTCCPLSMA